MTAVFGLVSLLLLLLLLLSLLITIISIVRILGLGASECMELCLAAVLAVHVVIIIVWFHRLVHIEVVHILVFLGGVGASHPIVVSIATGCRVELQTRGEVT